MPNTVHKPRIAVKEAALLGREGMDEMSCTIVDVSSDGFRLKVPRAVRCGGDYRLRFGSEEHAVVIRWASPGEVGGQFLD